jgi:hypothetical protein
MQYGRPFVAGLKHVLPVSMHPLVVSQCFIEQPLMVKKPLHGHRTAGLGRETEDETRIG